MISVQPAEHGAAVGGEQPLDRRLATSVSPYLAIRAGARCAADTSSSPATEATDSPRPHHSSGSVSGYLRKASRRARWGSAVVTHSYDALPAPERGWSRQRRPQGGFWPPRLVKRRQSTLAAVSLADEEGLVAGRPQILPTCASRGHRSSIQRRNWPAGCAPLRAGWHGPGRPGTSCVGRTARFTRGSPPRTLPAVAGRGGRTRHSPQDS